MLLLAQNPMLVFMAVQNNVQGHFSCCMFGCLPDIFRGSGVQRHITKF
jgi:hypothetical protein